MTTAPLTHANGVTLSPLRLPVNPAGPTSAWPRPQDDAGADAGTAGSPAAAVLRLSRLPAAVVSRLHAPDGDTVITWAMTGAAAAVILFAAIVSYSHIHALAVSHGEDSTQSHLLPLSIDGVIAEASLVMLFAARHRPMPTPALARVMLWTGIVATLAAYAVVALPTSWISPVANAVIGAVLSAWPAAAFIASVELVMLLVRDVRAVATRDSEENTTNDSGNDNDQDNHDGPKPAPRRKRDDPVTSVLRRHPDWDDDKIAAKCGVHKRTVSRRRKALEEAMTGQPPASAWLPAGANFRQVVSPGRASHPKGEVNRARVPARQRRRAGEEQRGAASYERPHCPARGRLRRRAARRRVPGSLVEAPG